jgi:hypothetical protein
MYLLYNISVLGKSIKAIEIWLTKIAQWECKDAETGKRTPDKNVIVHLQAIF